MSAVAANGRAAGSLLGGDRPSLRCLRGVLHQEILHQTDGFAEADEDGANHATPAPIVSIRYFCVVREAWCRKLIPALAAISEKVGAFRVASACVFIKEVKFRTSKLVTMRLTVLQEVRVLPLNISCMCFRPRAEAEEQTGSTDFSTQLF